MREKGGLHMEKMEHMDPQRCDRIWQRVSPELDPYPEVRAACREPSREPGAENIPERTGAAAVPAAPEIPAEPAESGCCLAGRAMGSIRLIQDFIEDELADRRAYLAYAACAPNVAARRLLRQLCLRHARRFLPHGKLLLRGDLLRLCVRRIFRQQRPIARDGQCRHTGEQGYV